jgi:hypothetical protein
MTSLRNKKPISKAKNSTNYSNAELSRRAKADAMKIVRKREIDRKSREASKKINDTWSGNKKTKPKKVNPISRLNEIGKKTKSSAQLRAIYAKKR